MYTYASYEISHASSKIITYYMVQNMPWRIPLLIIRHPIQPRWRLNIPQSIQLIIQVYPKDANKISSLSTNEVSYKMPTKHPIYQPTEYPTKKPTEFPTKHCIGCYTPLPTELHPTPHHDHHDDFELFEHMGCRTSDDEKRSKWTGEFMTYLRMCLVIRARQSASA